MANHRFQNQPIDEVAARELDLYAENTSQLYPQFQSIIANIKRRVKKGTYDPKLAPQLWMYWYESAAKQYAKEFASSQSEWSRIFPKALREHLAKQRAKDEYENVLRGEYDR